MNRIYSFLKLNGFNITFELVPDKKLKHFAANEKDTSFCARIVLFQNHSSESGEAFYTLVYDDPTRQINKEVFHTLKNPSGIDSMVISRNVLHASNQIKKDDQRLSEISDGLERKLLGEDYVTSDPCAEPNGMKIDALGFKENTYFFTSSSNPQLIPVIGFSDTDMLKMQPVEYWRKVFPAKSGSYVNWMEAKSTLMARARSLGYFDTKRVRGAGVWNDEGRTVINMGTHLLVDAQPMAFKNFKSKFFYSFAKEMHSLHPDALDDEGCAILVKGATDFRWRKPEYGFLLAGALVTARVCGALPIRPHLWLTGGASTGKSSLLQRLVRPLLGPDILYFTRGTTEAGLRQSLVANAFPVVFDEFETTDEKSRKDIGAVLDLLRSAWSESDALVVKGGVTGTAAVFQIRCSAIVTSIRTPAMNDADAQRFARIELAPHDSDAAHWNQLCGVLDQITPEYGERLFARTIKLMPVLLANFKMLKRLLSARGGARFGDQYGMLLAGYATLERVTALTEIQALKLIDDVRLDEGKETASRQDHEDALGHLLDSRVSLIVGQDRERFDFAVLDAIELATSEVLSNGKMKMALQEIGIRVESEFVAIARKHPELEKSVFRGTRWSDSWSDALDRLAGAGKSVVVKFGKRPVRCTTLPLSHFLQ